MRARSTVSHERQRRGPLAAVGWMCAAVVVCLSLAFPVSAHRDRGPGDRCRREVGASLLHITLYQTQFDPVSEYCEELPRVGSAFLVVDVTPDLWERPLGVELLALDDGGEARLVRSLPFQVYERGVADMDVVVQAGVRYEVRVDLGVTDAAEPRNFRFPFQVAAWYKALTMPVLVVLGLTAVVAISVVRYRTAGRSGHETAA